MASGADRPTNRHRAEPSQQSSVANSPRLPGCMSDARDATSVAQPAERTSAAAPPRPRPRKAPKA
eukprot:5097396-Prymnesium_polylepis.2